MSVEIVPDDLALRTGRRERALAQMEADDLDVLVLGRQANVRYVTGAPQLWVAGTRPFAPICVVVRATGEIHLNSSWDEGIPEEIGHDHLYGLAWNPMTLIEVLKNIDGAATARRVGTDALSPTFGQLLPMAFPNAELVDGEAAMRAARRVKTADEIRALQGALNVAEDGLAAAVAELAPGVSEQALTGVMLEAMAAGGVSTSATQDGAWITPREQSWRVGRRDRRIAEGDLVAFASGALAERLRRRGGTHLAGGRCEGRRRTCTGARTNCGTGWLPHVSPGRRPATCSPRTKRPANRCPRCRSLTGSASGSIRR